MGLLEKRNSNRVSFKKVYIENTIFYLSRHLIVIYWMSNWKDWSVKSKVESHKQFQKLNTETTVSLKMRFCRGTAGRRAGKEGLDHGRGGIPWLRGLGGSTEGSETQGKIKSFRWDAGRKDNSSVSYNLKINDTLVKIFWKGKLFSIIFF